MATESQKKRRELKEKRLAAEKQAKGDDRRQNVIKAIAAVAFLAIVGVIVAVVVASSGSDDGTSKSDSEIEKLLAGKLRVIEQGNHAELIQRGGYYKTLFELMSHTPGVV